MSDLIRKRSRASLHVRHRSHLRLRNAQRCLERMHIVHGAPESDEATVEVVEPRAKTIRRITRWTSRDEHNADARLILHRHLSQPARDVHEMLRAIIGAVGVAEV